MGTLFFVLLFTLIAAVFLFLWREISRLRQRISVLEEHYFLDLELEEEPEPTSSPPQSPSPPAPSPVVRAYPETEQSQGDQLHLYLQSFLALITRGNPVLKIGIIVLFLGIAFLLKYAAQRNMLPIELRLAAVAAGGVGALLTGWHLRFRHPAYALSLQGTGIGILYLVVFASGKLYQLLPLSFCLTVMVALVSLSGILAVLQNARSLAGFGSIGGFIAPVLMTSIGGNHLILFGYYALLNCGILGIAWFKAWRILNLIGFFFTFSIGSFWGVFSYTPELFATTEPFLLLFFFMYATIAVLFGLRQDSKLQGLIDGPLVFGLPLITFTLQVGLVRQIPFGLAYSSLGLGIFYCLAATMLWSRLTHRMRLLTEAFLALGVGFLSLALPLALDPHWTSAAWALEGGGLVWIGVRQQRRLARLFGMALQAGAGYFFLLGGGHHALLFADSFFLGCLFLASAALLSAYWLDSSPTALFRENHILAPLLLGWALCWWYGGGYVEVQWHLQHEQIPAFLLFTTFSTILATWATGYWHWPRLSYGSMLVLPILYLLTILALIQLAPHPSSLLQGLGSLGWPLAFLVLYGMLWSLHQKMAPRILSFAHLLSLWLLLFLISYEGFCLILRFPALAPSWSFAVWGVSAPTLLLLLHFIFPGLPRAFTAQAHVYRNTAPTGVGGALICWLLYSFTKPGTSAPLPYLPVLAPLDLAELFVLLFLWFHFVWPKQRAAGRYLASSQFFGLATLGFLWINSIACRSVHTFAAIPYTIAALFSATILQTTLAVLWGVLALSSTIWGAKKKKRPIWFVGAILLGLVVSKLFVIDLAGSGTISRIISFLIVGILMLIIGFFAPLPPKEEPAP